MQLNPRKLGISCAFDRPNGIYSIKDIVSGTVTIQPPEDIFYANFGYRIIWLIKNRNSSKQDEVVVLRQRWSSTAGSWKANQQYENTFKFRPAVPSTFKGKFFSIEWRVVLEVELRAKSRSLYKKAASRHLNINKMIFPTNQVSFHFPLEVKSEGLPFVVKPRKENYLFDANLPTYGIFAGVGLLGVVLNWGQFFEFPVFEVLGSAAMGYGIFDVFVSFGKLKEINIASSQGTNDTCNIQLEVGRNWSSIEKVRLRYYALEEYDLGESDDAHQTRSASIHSYQSQDFLIDDKITQITLPLPPKNKGLPATFNVHPYTVSWNLELTIILKNGREKDLHFNFPLTF